jgi:DNA-binding beta-propeller fold protein YncE
LIFKDGKQILSPPGKDTVSIIDISDPVNPRIVSNLPLENSIIGPPTNIAITPDNKLALVANSIDVVKDGDNWKNTPDNKVYVIDLTASPPAVITTLQVGKQPSGLAINRAGNLALVANRADNSVTVLSISGKNVSIAGTVALAPPDAPPQQPSAVAITPDGKHALVAKALANKVALLDIDGTTVTYKGYDMVTGLFPYNVQVTADGKLALVNHNGNAGIADGQVSTMGVIDLTLDPPREVDQVVVGDGPEGLAVSPTSGYAVTLPTNGSGGSVPDNAFFRHDHAVAVLLQSDGKTVHKVGQTEVGALAEGIAFSPDGRYVYVANWGEQDLVTYRLDGDKLVAVGTPLKLPGHPASMGSTP